MILGCRHLRIAHDDERLRDDRADRALLTGLWNRHAFESRAVPDGIRRVAVRYLPREVAAIKVDGL